MGYYMNQLSTQFVIKRENLPNVTKAIKNLHGKETIGDSSGKHFSWVSNHFYEINTAQLLLEAWRWVPKFDDNGDIIELKFRGEKWGDEKFLFEAIAPFVENNSWIEMEGEEGSKWKWVFVDKSLIKEVMTNPRQLDMYLYGGGKIEST